MNSIQENDSNRNDAPFKLGRKRLPLKKRQPANMILEQYAIDAPSSSASSPELSTDAAARSQSESESSDSSKDENKTNLPSRKKKRSSKSSTSHSTSANKTKRPYKKRKTDPSKNRGHWTNEEKVAFLNGLRKYGKGKWSKIASEIPTRTAIQVKTHAQGVLMKMENGEDVYKIGNRSTKSVSSSRGGSKSPSSNPSIVSLSSSGAYEESTIPNSRTSSPSFEVGGTDNSVSLHKSSGIQNPDPCTNEEYADAIGYINDVVENSLSSSHLLNSFATPSATRNTGFQSILAPVTNSALINNRFYENTASVVNPAENESLHTFLTPVTIRATFVQNEGGVSASPMSPLVEEKDQEMLSLAAKILLDLASPQGSVESKA